MTLSRCFLVALAALAHPAGAANWAIVVTGSHTYDNYRHHADVAHAYVSERELEGESKM